MENDLKIVLDNFFEKISLLIRTQEKDITELNRKTTDAGEKITAIQIEMAKLADYQKLQERVEKIAEKILHLNDFKIQVIAIFGTIQVLFYVLVAFKDKLF